MAELLTQKEVLHKLYINKVCTFKASSFSEAVKIGKIPYKVTKEYKSKMYIYEDVKKAILSANIGNKGTKQKLDAMRPPKKGQSVASYGAEVVKELGGDATLTDANTYKALYQGKLEKLKFDKEMELYIERSLVEDKAFSVARAIRDKILSIPERMSNELASLEDAHEIKELLYKEFYILLDGFSGESLYDN